MRYPWIQVTQDAFTVADHLAAMTGTDADATLGKLNRFWAWAVSLGPDDAPPRGLVTGPMAAERLAAALRLPTEPERLATILEALGVVERIPSGFRVKGLHRYKATWEKNRRRTGTGKDRTGTVPADDSNPPDRNETGPAPDRQTQTQTESSSTPVGEPAAPGGQESLFPSPTPTPKAKASKATPEGLEFRALSEALGQEFQAARKEAYPWRTKAGPSNAAVKSLVALRPADATPESHRAEVVRRWGLALRHDNAFHRVDDMAKFASRYAAYGPEGSATVEAGRGGATQRPKDVKRGWADAADSRATHATAPVGVMKDF